MYFYRIRIIFREIYLTHKCTTTQSKPGSNANEGVPQTPQSSKPHHQIKISIIPKTPFFVKKSYPSAENTDSLFLAHRQVD